MVRNFFLLIFALLPAFFFAEEDDFAAPNEDMFNQDEEIALFRDLELVEKINKEVSDRLPVIYNSSLIGGYLNMPSARMTKTGTVAAGFARDTPYDVYGVNFQMFDRIEMSANYRIFNGVTEQNFGNEGFGDDAERIGNIKIGILVPEDGFPRLPSIAVGANDFIGTQRFNSQYVVMTKEFLKWNLECTLGWGRKGIDGFFGGVTWTPFRRTSLPVLKDISLIAEYDATDYKNNEHQHPSARVVKSRVNGGISFIGWDTLQLSISSVRGEDLAGSASIRYPLGTTTGLLPKIGDPASYQSPVDTEPLGVTRTEPDFIHGLAYAFSDQGLDLYTAFLCYDADGGKVLWLKIVNNRYREERVVRDRLRHVLAALTPSDVKTILVIIEADAVPCHAYQFRNEDLEQWRAGLIGDYEMDEVAPMREAPHQPSSYDAALIFQRRKPIWTFTVLPRLQTFFGSASGKFKYNLSAVIYPEGYIFNQIYYRFQVSYAISSSMSGTGGPDRLNPSKLPNVRTDTLRYFQTNSFSMEKAFLQKTWNLGRGWFYRLAAGYFEPAYGGGATELLYYPVGSDWAIGAQFAAVMKRHYHGIKFTNTVGEYKDGKIRQIPFTGIQAFLDIYYDFKPLKVDVLVTAGKFLARDLGVRTEVGRYFKSGMRFALWYTVTNGHDHVNGSTYFDKGFLFSLPLDMFLTKSSRTYLGYGMSAWLRDVGARAETGKQLYWTLEEERYSY